MIHGGAIRGVAALMAGLLVGIGPVSAVAQTQIEGVWQTQLQAEITISPCEQGYCGRISKVVVPDQYLEGSAGAAIQQMQPEDFFDANNKDPLLRGRPILGLQILTLTPSEQPHLFDGEIYNPEDGNTYSGYMEVLGPDKVRLNGCVLFNVVCRGEDWIRVSQR
jgi:uncharacterized protein (DUF2147 family)